MTIAVALTALTPLLSTHITTEYVGLIPVHMSLDYQRVSGEAMKQGLLESGVTDPDLFATAEALLDGNVDVYENYTYAMNWFKLQYAEDVSSVDDVNVTLYGPLDSDRHPADAEARQVLGRLSSLYVQRGLALSARIDDESGSLIALLDANAAIYDEDDAKARSSADGDLSNEADATTHGNHLSTVSTAADGFDSPRQRRRRRLQRLQRLQLKLPAARALTAQSDDDDEIREASEEARRKVRKGSEEAGPQSRNVHRKGVPNGKSHREIKGVHPTGTGTGVGDPTESCIGGSDDDGFVTEMGSRYCSELTIVPKDASMPIRSLNFQPDYFQGAYPGYFQAHHTLTITTLASGQRVALVTVAYHDPTFSNYTLTDSIAAVDLKTFELVPTADGEMVFKMLGSIAVYGDTGKSAYKLQLQGCDLNEAGQRDCEANSRNGGFDDVSSTNAALHMNGIDRFVGPDGTAYLALTFQRSYEAVVITCPWTYTTHYQRGRIRASVGGGIVHGSSIVQRFGTPNYWNEANYNGSVPFYTAPKRFFGFPKDSHIFSEGIHNVFYTPASPTPTLRGKPTLTILANYDAVHPDPEKSFLFEFEFRPVPEGSSRDTGDDTVFDTSYVNLRMPFHASMNGGARPIGNGVYVAAAGDDPDASFCVVDLKNGSVCSKPYWDTDFIAVYDPFIRVLV